jgi:DNA repair photolyase
MPVMPQINDAAEDLELLLRLASEAGASYIASQVLFLRSSAKKRFFPFLADEFPDLLPLYRRLYAASHTEALSTYTRQKMAEIRRLKQQYGLISRGMEQQERNRSPEQMSLWG